MVKTYQVVCSAAPVRLSTALFAGDESKNIPFRQLVIQSVGADAFLGGDGTLTIANGVKAALAAPMPLSLGPFDTGPVKLSDLWAVGTGATLNILGVPY